MRSRVAAFDATTAVHALVDEADLGAATPTPRTVVPGNGATAELFDGERLVVEPLEVAVSRPVDADPGAPGAWVEWLGAVRVDGAVTAQVTMVFRPEAGSGYVAAGSVMSPEGQVVIERVGGETYRLDQLATSSTLPQGDDTGDDLDVIDGPGAGLSPEGGEAVVAASTVDVDVIVAYGNGNPGDVVSRIGAKVGEANNALATSGINLRLNVLATPYVNYTQHSSDMVVDRNSLRDGVGSLAALHTQRDQLGADLVGLVVPNATNYCGQAYFIPPAGGNTNMAWQVSANACFDVDRHVLVHEFGHLLGGRHNPEVDGTASPYAYSHGKAVNAVARTIMAYDTTCLNGCPMRLQFSNPNQAFIGFPGVPSGDSSQRNNTLSLNNLAPYVAGYRARVPQPRPWIQVAGGTVASDVDAAWWAAGRVDVVARSSSGSLLHRALVNGSWTAWQDLGKPGLLGLGSIVGGPTAVSWGANRLDVFARGNDNHLWHKWWNGNSWSGWEDLGGSLTSDPDVASWAAGRLDVFARGTGNRMFHRAYQSGTLVGLGRPGRRVPVGPGRGVVGLGTDRHLRPRPR